MKQGLILNTHSIVDVITNSSSELFVCDTTKTNEFIADFLQSAIELSNKADDSSRTYEDCIGSIKQITEESFPNFFDQYVVGWNFHTWSMGVDPMIDYFKFKEDYRNKMDLHFKYPYDKNRTFNKKIEDECEKAHEEYVKEWKEKNYETLKQWSIGKTLIFSADENSIPYSLFDLIENVFYGNRIHLG